MAANNRKRARRDNSQETSEEAYPTEAPTSVNTTTYIPPVSIPPDFVRVDSDDPFGISKM